MIKSVYAYKRCLGLPPRERRREEGEEGLAMKMRPWISIVSDH